MKPPPGADPFVMSLTLQGMFEVSFWGATDLPHKTRLWRYRPLPDGVVLLLDTTAQKAPADTIDPPHVHLTPPLGLPASRAQTATWRA